MNADARRGLIGLVVLAALAGGVLLLAIGGSTDEADRRGGAAAERLRDAAAEHRSIRVADLVDVPVDRLEVLPGGGRAEQWNRQLGFTWGRAKDLDYECCDAENVWALVRGHEVVAWFRPGVEAHSGPSGRGFPASAKIRVVGRAVRIER